MPSRRNTTSIPTITRELAFASGQDAGCANMRKHCRKSWNDEDVGIAASTTNRLLLYVSAANGGLGGLPISAAMVADLGLTMDQVQRASREAA